MFIRHNDNNAGAIPIPARPTPIDLTLVLFDATRKQQPYGRPPHLACQEAALGAACDLAAPAALKASSVSRQCRRDHALGQSLASSHGSVESCNSQGCKEPQTSVPQPCKEPDATR